MKRESSGRLFLTQDVARRCNVSAQAVRQWGDRGWLTPDHVTPGGVAVYYAEAVEDFARRREGYAVAGPRLKAAYGLLESVQGTLEIPSNFDSPPEGFVE